MKKGQLQKEIWAIMLVTALTEAVCGKESMKLIAKRLKALNHAAAQEVWLGVYNKIYIKRRVYSDEIEYRTLPIVKEERRRILKLIRSKATTDIRIYTGQMKKIIVGKIRIMEEESK